MQYKVVLILKILYNLLIFSNKKLNDFVCFLLDKSVYTFVTSLLQFNLAAI